MGPNGMGLASFEGPSSARIINAEKDSSPTRKRAAPNWLFGSSKESGVRIEEMNETHENIDLAQVLTIDGQENILPEENVNMVTPRRNFVRGTENTERSRTRS